MNWDTIFKPEMAPIWAAVGALLVKGIDYLQSKKKGKTDTNSAQLGHLNEATKTLIDGLFQQINSLGKTVERLEGEIAALRKENTAKDERIEHLEAEIDRMRAYRG